MRTLKARIKTPEQYEKLNKAVKNYRAFCVENNKEPQYIMLFSTWANQWEDWADDDAGSCNIDVRSTNMDSNLRLLSQEIS